MRKSTIFISAVLTTFALALLSRIVLAYNDNKNAAQTAAQPIATLAPTATEPAAPTQPVFGPVEAAQRAAQIVGNTNLLSAESSTYNGVDAYMITFTNKDVVFVGLDGQVLSVQVAPVVVNAAPAPKQKHKERDQHVSSGGEEHHEEHHEEEHED